MKWTRLFVAFAAVVALLSCHLLLGIDNRRPDGGAADAETDAGDEVSAEICQTRGEPPPSPDGGPAMPEDTWTFALYKIFYGLDGGVEALNLDRYCTCPGQNKGEPGTPTSCQVPPGVQIECDGLKGEDNAGFDLLKTISLFVKEDELNTNLAEAISAALIQIRKYNGAPNDNDIAVDVAPALGIEGDGGLKLDGGDRWIEERGASKSTMSAYIVNRRLVAAFSAVTFSAGGGPYDAGLPQPIIQPPIRMDLSDAVIVATLSADGMSLKGTLAGRWSAEKLLKSIEAFPDRANYPQTLCGTNFTYSIIKGNVCNLRDISEAPTGFFTCNALSFAIGFEARRATIGDAGDREDAGHPCGASWMPTCN
jgi:hypothetical protein